MRLTKGRVVVALPEDGMILVAKNVTVVIT